MSNISEERKQEHLDGLDERMMDTPSLNYNINEEERDKAIEWLKSHDCEKPFPSVKKWIFIPNAISMNVEIECVCGKVSEITDFGCW